MSIFRGDHGKVYLYKDQNRGHWFALWWRDVVAFDTVGSALV